MYNNAPLVDSITSLAYAMEAGPVGADADRAERAMSDHILAARQSFRDVVQATATEENP
jgi:hypothetical protein